jgi:16S rRNA (adenine1518-N6/adenine1519-N6)-dimethyltransferase
VDRHSHHRHHPRKRFGQHFLHDAHVLQQMLSLIHPKQPDHLVEIGPGQGALTDYLVQSQWNRLDLIEIDRDLAPHLSEKYKIYSSLHVHCQDILSFDLETLAADQPLRIVGNLPYNISTPLLFKLFEALSVIKDMHFLLQKEVVERLTASVGSHNYNRLSVMTQYFCKNQLLLYVSAQAFTPPPQVESAFVRLTPHQPLPVEADDFFIFRQVVQEAFSHRRKTISNALKRLVSPSELEMVGIGLKRRPQELSVADFVHISNALSKKQA